MVEKQRAQFLKLHCLLQEKIRSNSLVTTAPTSVFIRAGKQDEKQFLLVQMELHQFSDAQSIKTQKRANAQGQK